VFGVQQHGLSDLQFLGEVLRDPALLDDARAAAQGVARTGGRAGAILDALRGGWRKRLELAQVG
jgi:hypothetical protein